MAFSLHQHIRRSLTKESPSFSSIFCQTPSRSLSNSARFYLQRDNLKSPFSGFVPPLVKPRPAAQSLGRPTCYVAQSQLAAPAKELNLTEEIVVLSGSQASLKATSSSARFNAPLFNYWAQFALLKLRLMPRKITMTGLKLNHIKVAERFKVSTLSRNANSRRNRSHRLTNKRILRVAVSRTLRLSLERSSVMIAALKELDCRKLLWLE